MTDFSIAIKNGQVIVLCTDQVPETDIIDLLEFDESKMEDLYKNHASIQARWEQIAINLKNDFDRFEEEFVKKWWAHNKRFAKLYLLGQGEKNPTVDAIRDTTILMTSQDTSTEDRSTFAYFAHKASLTKGSDRDIQLSLDEFENKMYLYLRMNPSWYFETLTSVVKTMEKNYLTVHNICKRLESRSFHMKELKDLLMAKESNIGPMTLRENRNKDQLEKDIASGRLLGM